MAGNEPKDRGPGGAPGGNGRADESRPWIIQRDGRDDVDAYAILVDFANSLGAARLRVLEDAERYQRAGSQDERDRIIHALRIFLRAPIGFQCIAFSVLGGELPFSVMKGKP